MEPKPAARFPGESGFALLKCTLASFNARGKMSCSHYRMAGGRSYYVDVRDLSGWPKAAFERVDDADIDPAVEGAQEAP